MRSATLIRHTEVVVAGLLSRKADRFAALLDDPDPLAAAGNDPALAHFASLTQRLASIPGPSAAFHSTLREQLVAAAGSAAPAAVPAAAGSTVSTGSAGSATHSGTLSVLTKSAPLWVKFATGVAAVAIAATGVGIGAHRALPGDFFYGVKRQVESLQLDLADGGRETATTRLGFAHARADELQGLVGREKVTPKSVVSQQSVDRLHKLLQDWTGDAGAGTASLMKELRAIEGTSTDLSADLRKTLHDFTYQQFRQIGGLLTAIPPGPLQNGAVSALVYLQQVDRAIGGDPAKLIKQLPVPLSSIPGAAGVAARLGVPLTGASGGSTPGGTPGTAPSTGGAPSTGRPSSGSGGTTTSQVPATQPAKANPGGTLPEQVIPTQQVPSPVVAAPTLPAAEPSSITLPTALPTLLPLPSLLPSNVLPSNLLPSNLIPKVFPSNVLPTLLPKVLPSKLPLLP